ncbi:SH3 domain-containing protein [Streptomyces lavendulocolor]|uniref:SH3 domain-containing protein n=1 Tax=Streptomyces lavendulocolor TaxID=67316 RepID=A0ABV2WGE6_9ACTN
MRSTLIYAAVVGALLAPAAPAAAQPHTAPASMPTAVPTNPCGFHITGSSVNLRSGAGTRYASLGHLREGDDVALLGERGTWYKVRLRERSASGIREGATGWVAKRYVKKHICMQLN